MTQEVGDPSDSRRTSPSGLGELLARCESDLLERRLDDAWRCARAAIAHPDYQPHLFGVPHKAFRAVCDFDGIRRLGDIWVSLERASSLDHSGTFLEMLSLADSDEKTAGLSWLHRKWGESILDRHRGSRLEPVRPGSRSGRIRIGIMSSDLRRHPVGNHVLPVLENYDREAFEIIAYAPHEVPQDPVQNTVRELVAAFTVTGDASAGSVAERVRADRIDILFELNGFTPGNMLAVLAYRPAPVQIYWLGYAFTTGIAAVDYILLDPLVKPENEAWLVETALLMPESWVCFRSFDSEPIDATPPCERNGYVTFGSLNNPIKLTPGMVALWCDIMQRVPGSRFLYVRPECRSRALCDNLTAEFRKHGIGADRLRVVDNGGLPVSHLSFYNEMDISLDTYPVTGGTTTCDALMMGVPVVSKVGPSLHQRLSFGLMASVGLQEFCVRTDDDYRDAALALSRDRERLRRLRRDLRPMVEASSLGRTGDFSRHFFDLMKEVACRHGLR